ncbi:MAG TPA: FecR domain-containing protein [Beijerinckiaceae bacterium]
MLRLRSPTLGAAFLVGLAAAFPAHAAREKIGGATSIERDVTGAFSGEERKVAQGDDVFLDETVRTAALSAAKLRFVDETDLSLGPQASVKLDRYVFNPDKTAKAMAVTMTKGAMRWVSGISPSSAYQIRTPQATIGVRGTIFDLVADARRTTVVLQEGAVEVCTTGPRRVCRMLTTKGDVITVAGNAIEGPRPGGPGSSDFASRCLSATSRTCAITAKAEPAPKQAKTRFSAKPPQAEPPRRRVVRDDPPPRTLPRRRVVEANPVIEEEIVPVRSRRVVDVYDDPGFGRPWRRRYDAPVRIRPPYGGRPGGYWPGGRGPGMGQGGFRQGGIRQGGIRQGLGRPGRFAQMPGGRYGMASPMGGFAFRGGGFGLR